MNNKIKCRSCIFCENDDEIKQQCDCISSVKQEEILKLYPEYFGQNYRPQGLRIDYDKTFDCKHYIEDPQKHIMYDEIMGYIKSRLQDNSININIIFEDEGGFRHNCYSDDGGFVNLITVPRKRANLGLGSRLSLSHEVGHVFFNELYYQTPGMLEILMQHIKRKKWFVWLQWHYYWSPVLRQIRIWMGYSNKLWYKPGDVMYPGSTPYTHADVELFCDCFALFGGKITRKIGRP